MLHVHLMVWWGGLSLRVLQQAGGVQHLCDAVAKVLDSTYCAEAPSKMQGHYVLRKSLQKFGVPNKDLPRVDSPLLLQFRLVGTVMEKAMKNPTKVNVYDAICDNCMRKHFHSHHNTCTKGFRGNTGCRLCKPSNPCPETHPVELVPLYSKDKEGWEKDDLKDAEYSKRHGDEISAVSQHLLQEPLQHSN